MLAFVPCECCLVSDSYKREKLISFRFECCLIICLFLFFCINLLSSEEGRWAEENGINQSWSWVSQSQDGSRRHLPEKWPGKDGEGETRKTGSSRLSQETNCKSPEKNLHFHFCWCLLTYHVETAVLMRSPKLSNSEPGHYLDVWQIGSIKCCHLGWATPILKPMWVANRIDISQHRSFSILI